jgi:hypothetical protein
MQHLLPITINKDILVNYINFIIEINIINHFFKIQVESSKHYYFETEGVKYMKILAHV